MEDFRPERCRPPKERKGFPANPTANCKFPEKVLRVVGREGLHLHVRPAKLPERVRIAPAGLHFVMPLREPHREGLHEWEVRSTIANFHYINPRYQGFQRAGAKRVSAEIKRMRHVHESALRFDAPCGLPRRKFWRNPLVEKEPDEIAVCG